MTDFSDMGARRTSGLNTELTPAELKRAQEEALVAFMNLYPVNPILIRRQAHAMATLWAVQREIREEMSAKVAELGNNDLLSESDFEIISEHIFRRLGDAHSQADTLHRTHDDLLAVDFNDLLTRYKGA